MTAAKRKDDAPEGAETGPNGPNRRCVATGAVQPKERMIRFVLGPAGEIVPDLAERLPGRGMWVSSDRTALDRAARKGLFSRAARSRAVRPVTPPEDLADGVAALMRERCLGLIGLARRSGATAVGFENAKALVASGRAGLLLEASDGAADGRARLRQLASAAGGAGLRVVGRFTRAELGEAVGRDDAVHVALAKGGLADALARETERLTGLEGPEDRPIGMAPAGPDEDKDASTTGRRTR